MTIDATPERSANPRPGALDRLRDMRERSLEAGGQKRIDAQHGKGKMTARERVDFLLDEGSFVELDRYVTHRCTNFGHGGSEDPRRRRRDGSRPHRRPSCLRLQPGLHGLRRQPLRDPVGEDLQGHGPRHEGGGAGDRAERLRRRAHPGGRLQPRRLRRDLLAQHARQRGRPAALRHPRPLRRWRRLQPRPDRLHRDGGGELLHAHHRPRRGQDGDARGGDQRGPRRRGGPQPEVGRRALRDPRRQELSPAPAQAALVPAPQQRRGAADRRDRRPRRSRGRGPGHDRPHRTPRSPTTCAR